jgi:O-antigen/teichoic acid export membrane protein
MSSILSTTPSSNALIAYFDSLCIPAKIYSVTNVLITLMNIFLTIKKGNKGIVTILMSTLLSFLIIGGFTWFLSFICKKGYTKVAWSFAIMAIVFFSLFIIKFIKKLFTPKKEEKETEQQII